MTKIHITLQEAGRWQRRKTPRKKKSDIIAQFRAMVGKGSIKFKDGEIWDGLFRKFRRKLKPFEIVYFPCVVSGSERIA